MTESEADRARARHAARRRLEALTLAARDLGTKARGAAERASLFEEVVRRVESASGDAGGREDLLRALPDPRASRLLAATLAGGGGWDEVAARARALLEEARDEARRLAGEAAATETLRAGAEAEANAPDLALERTRGPVSE